MEEAVPFAFARGFCPGILLFGFRPGKMVPEVRGIREDRIQRGATMDEPGLGRYTAFEGTRRIASGALSLVALVAKEVIDRGGRPRF